MHISKNYQREFFEDFFMEFELNQNHELIKLEKELPWDILCEIPAKYYSHNMGRPTKPSRSKVALMILKHLYQLSDQELVKELGCNLYYQYFCDLPPKKAQNFIDPSLLTKFRKTIGVEGIKEIEEIVNRVIEVMGRRGKRGPKKNHLIIDTTIIPSPIEYPTDVKLLEKCRRKCVEILDKAKKYGVSKFFRTYKRVAKAAVDIYQKMGRHEIKIRRRMQKKLLLWVNRNVKQVEESREILKEKTESRNKIVNFMEKTAKVLTIVKNILLQQRKIYSGTSIKNRIVSLWNDKIRPMIRGKYPVSVEFGPKALLVKKDKFLYLADMYYDNVNDTQLLKPSLDYYKKRWEKPPDSLAADRGFFSKNNLKLAEEEKIKQIGIQRKGKSNNKFKPVWERKLYRLRCSIEAKISLGKRKFGLDRIGYRIEGGEEMWIRLGLMAMNLKAAVNSG